jgi:hypothetical protein
VLAFFFLAVWTCVSFLFIEVAAYSAGWFRALLLLISASFAAWRMRKDPASVWKTLAFLTAFVAACILLSESLLWYWIVNRESASSGPFPAVLVLPRLLLIALLIALLVDSHMSQSEGRIPKEYAAALYIFIAALCALPPWRPLLIVCSLVLPLVFALPVRAQGPKTILPMAMAGGLTAFALLRFAATSQPALYPFTHWATIPYALLFGHAAAGLIQQVRAKEFVIPGILTAGLVTGWACELFTGRVEGGVENGIFVLRNGFLAWVFVHAGALGGGFALNQILEGNAALKQKSFWISAALALLGPAVAFFLALQFRIVRTSETSSRESGIFQAGVIVSWQGGHGVCGEYTRALFRAQIPAGPFRANPYVAYQLGDLSLPRGRLTSLDIVRMAEKLDAKVVLQDASAAAGNQFQSSQFASSINPLTSGITLARSGEFLYIALEDGRVSSVTRTDDLTDGGCSKGKLPYTFRENPAFRKEYAEKIKWIKPLEVIVKVSGPSLDAPAKTAKPLYNLFYGMVVSVAAEVDSDGGWYLTEAGFAPKDRFTDLKEDLDDAFFEDPKNLEFEAHRPVQDLKAMLGAFRDSCQANGYGTGILTGTSAWIDSNRFVALPIQWKREENKSPEAYVDFSGVEVSIGRDADKLAAEYADTIRDLARDAKTPEWADAGQALLVGRTSVFASCQVAPMEFEQGRPSYYAHANATVKPIRIRWEPPEMKKEAVRGFKVYYSSRLPRIGSAAAEKFCKKEGYRLPAEEELTRIVPALKPESSFARSSFWFSNCAPNAENTSEPKPDCKIEKTPSADEDAAVVCVEK